MRKNPDFSRGGDTHTSETIGEEVRERFGEMTPSERRVARTLLATYPTAGLESLPRLADDAGVTGPTVLRFVRKIGFDGYPDFQRSLREEVQARTEGLPSLYRTKGATQDDDVLRRTQEAFTTRSGRHAHLELARGRTGARRRAPGRSEAPALVRGRAFQPARRDLPLSADASSCARGARWWARSLSAVCWTASSSRAATCSACSTIAGTSPTRSRPAGRRRAGRGRDRLHRPVALAGGRARAPRADLARRFGVAVRLDARGVRAHGADRGEGRGGARRTRPSAGRRVRDRARTIAGRDRPRWRMPFRRM